jgi:hypothetical protein
MRRPAVAGCRIRFQANRLALGAECDAFSIVSGGTPDVKNLRRVRTLLPLYGWGMHQKSN